MLKVKLTLLALGLGLGLQGQKLEAGEIMDMRLSPDGQHAVVTRKEKGTGIYDAAGKAVVRWEHDFMDAIFWNNQQITAHGALYDMGTRQWQTLTTDILLPAQVQGLRVKTKLYSAKHGLVVASMPHGMNILTSGGDKLAEVLYYDPTLRDKKPEDVSFMRNNRGSDVSISLDDDITAELLALPYQRLNWALEGLLSCDHLEDYGVLRSSADGDWAGVAGIDGGYQMNGKRKGVVLLAHLPTLAVKSMPFETDTLAGGVWNQHLLIGEQRVFLLNDSHIFAWEFESGKAIFANPAGLAKGERLIGASIGSQQRIMAYGNAGGLYTWSAAGELQQASYKGEAVGLLKRGYLLAVADGQLVVLDSKGKEQGRFEDVSIGHPKALVWLSEDENTLLMLSADRKSPRFIDLTKFK